MSSPQPTLSQDNLQSIVIGVLDEMTADWDLDDSGEINLETRLIDELAFESIDVVQLVVALEKKLGRKDIPFEKLFIQEGDYVEEITVREVVDFLKEQL